jgi:hypothetical protein
MKIPLLSGRDFLPQDTSPGVAIVNETFVNTYFPRQNLIGRTLEGGANHPLNKIVGVTADSQICANRAAQESSVFSFHSRWMALC